METDEIKNLETIKGLTAAYLNTLKPVDGKSNIHTAQIRVYDYYELSAVIRNLLKIFIVALDHEAPDMPSTIESKPIDVGLILGIALQLFPIDEFELLNEISTLFPTDYQNSDKKKS
ncbi:hypothetical protein [Flavobacterium sp. 5]|uniref:hypothetical protein n=1 Tax=Flavobacterium sp. 5 TaxID=2035199 RepID=UPI000C2B82DA|nr:hypothetical protein [Flavobacterium sp. 5]PKB18830.1 hypothetical protein CLU82_4124 [Flavobacterium sp. 5]